MPLTWSIHDDLGMVEITGSAVVDRRDLEDYMAAITAADAKGFRKLFDLRRAELALDPEGIRAVAGSISQFDKGNAGGPVAIVVGSALSLDMAVLLKQRVRPDRPFRIFTSLDEAEAWLADQPLVRPSSLGASGRSGSQD